MADISNIERQQRILDLINKERRASVKELSTLFNTSEVTVRNDLNKLSKQGYIIRTHGGAIYTDENRNRNTKHVPGNNLQNSMKEDIGKVATSFVKNGDVIFIGSSITAYNMVPYLEQKHDITIITNSIRVLCSLANMHNIHVITIGGKLKKETMSMVNYSFENILKVINIGKVFLGADGFTIEDGLTAIYEEEVQIKKKILEKCKIIYALIDSTKWGKTSLIKLVETDSIDKFITDANAPRDMINQLQRKGIETILTGPLKNHTLIY
jgi:DeoR family transcriptional regulator of aga operon